MAEEVVAVSPASPVPSDHKRKIDDFQPEALQHTEATPQQPPADVTDVSKESGDVTVGGESPSAKRPKLDDDKSDGLACENGFKDRKEDEHAKPDTEEPSVKVEQGEGDSRPSPSESLKKEQGEGDARHSPSKQVTDTMNKEEPAADNHETIGAQGTPIRDSETEKTENFSKEENDKAYHESTEPSSENQITSHKMEVPNDKVGVLIGKGGDTIRFLQYNSGAKIQITKDADADPQSATRAVEIIGTSSCIEKAEKLIAAVIAEADAGGSPSLVARGLTSAGTTGLGDQLEIQVPNDKVGLIIGKGGETIKSLQTKSGARIQLIPQHLPEGDKSKERTVRITGDRRKIEIAREMIMDVMNQTVRPYHPSGFYQQQQYRPRGPSGPGHWGPRGPLSSRSMPYDYQQRGPYPSQSLQYPPSHGSYPPQQVGPRSTYGSSWEQRPPSMQRSLPHGGGYDYYSGQGGNEPHHPALPQPSAPISGHAPGPSPALLPSQANYYGHQAPYSQAAHPQPGYGHGYDEPKLHAPAQHHYGHGSSQPVYSQPTSQPGYGAQHQYGKQPSYGAPSQGSGPQAYAPPRTSLPGDMPYQAPVQSAHSYGSNITQQQQYPYSSTAPMQQTYPQYGSVPATDGYSQAQSASAGYPPQVVQPVQTYGQPSGQQAGYVLPSSGVYGSYASSQQGYAEQPVSGYQGPPDTALGNSGQPGYAQQSGQYAQPATQPSYDPSAQHSGGYAAAPASAPVG